MQNTPKKTPITNKEEFILFLENFIKDLKENKKEWENSTLQSYLEAMKSWLEDSDGFYNNLDKKPPNNCYEYFAEILLAAKVYE